MPARVTLTVTAGEDVGQVFVIEERTTCIVGRASDCDPQIPDPGDQPLVSRHHCLLDINPPDVRLRDFGSLNGTYVNGEKIGSRAPDQSPEQGAALTLPERDLRDGDGIELGGTILRVAVFVPVSCADCGVEIAEPDRAKAERSPGVYQCDGCRAAAERTRRPAPPKPKPKRCARCGKQVAGEAGAQRKGAFVCQACREEPIELLKALLEQARAGDQQLGAICGYALVRELGHGGMGAVYLARHEDSGEQVALKVMLPQVAADEVATRRFLRETENTLALRHPHVVEFRDAGCSEGTFYFTVEYCDGGSVEALRRRRGGTLAPEEAVWIICQTLRGLEYAHQAKIPRVRLADGSYRPGRGLVHRDLSPDNILLTSAGGERVAKVSDLGLGKAFDLAGLSGLTRSGDVIGKPQFMARQQILNFRDSQPEVDVWAAAACLYVLLTGCSPRDFPRRKDIWRAVLENDAVRIRKRDKAIAKKLAMVIDEALVDRPRIQITTAAELRRALEGAL